MRAAFVRQLGDAGQIEVADLPTPTRRDDQFLVRVLATSVNRVDTYVRSGLYRTDVPLPLVLSRDLVGEVVEAPSGSDLPSGSRVWCTSLGHDGRQGAAAELAVVDRDRLYAMPAGADPGTLVAVAHPGSTAYLAVVEHGRARSGETVVVRGAAGNVGSAAVVIAVAQGARVVAVASRRDAAYCLGLGAHAVVAKDEEDADAALERAVGRHGVDLWIDAHGGNQLTSAVNLLAIGGRIVFLAGPTSSAVLPTGPLYLKDGEIKGFVISRASTSQLASAAARVGELCASSRLLPRRVMTAGLDDLARLHRAVEAGELSGMRAAVWLDQPGRVRLAAGPA